MQLINEIHALSGTWGISIVYSHALWNRVAPMLQNNTAKQESIVWIKCQTLIIWSYFFLLSCLLAQYVKAYVYLQRILMFPPIAIILRINKINISIFMERVQVMEILISFIPDDLSYILHLSNTCPYMRDFLTIL